MASCIDALAAVLAVVAAALPRLLQQLVADRVAAAEHH